MSRSVPCLLVPLWLAGCAPEGRAPAVEIMPEVLATMPSFDPASSSARVFAPGDAVDDFTIVQRFGLECHWEDESPGACPPGVPIDLSTKYSSDRILGLLAHAELFTNEVYGRTGASTCAAGGGRRAVDLAREDFVSDDEGGDGGLYLVDALDRLDCAATLDGSPRVAAWSRFDGSRYESVLFVKGEAGTDGADQSMLTQSLVLRDAAGKPRVVAMNTAGVTLAAGTSAMRATVVANLATRRFLVKSSGGPDGQMVAAGQGGLTVAGARQPGTWFGRSNETPDGVCVDNPTRAAAAASSCAVEGAAWPSGTTPASYLGLSASDAALLEPWLALWSDGATASFLPQDEVPRTAEDRVNLPDRIP